MPMFLRFSLLTDEDKVGYSIINLELFVKSNPIWKRLKLLI